MTAAADDRNLDRPRPGPARVVRPVRPHPGPIRATLPAAIRDALVAHARADYPNEACGLIAGTAPAAEGGTATGWHPTRNRAASPLRYEIHPDDLLRVSLAIDDADEVTWGIVHSHVRSPARPSPTDVGLASYPEALYLLVSLARDEPGLVPRAAGSVPGPVPRAAGSVPDAVARDEPGLAPRAAGVVGAERVRAWRIVDGTVFEVALDIVAEAG